MIGNRDQLVVLLLSFRDNDAQKRDDLNGFSRSSGLRAGQFRVLSAVERAPTVDDLDGVDAVMIGGSKWSVFEDVPNIGAAKSLLEEARHRGLPVLGVCFGHQLLAATFGGEVVRDEEHEEFGSFDVSLSAAGHDDPLFAGMSGSFKAICGHHDSVAVLPEGAVHLASSERCPNHAFRLGDDPIYGVQFHPEHTAESFREVMDTLGRRYFSDDDKVDQIISRIDDAPEASEVPARFIDRIVLGS